MQLDSRDREKETDAARYCERRYPRDVQLQNSCIQYETDKRKHLPLSGGDVRLDADRAAKVMCASRWPQNLTLQHTRKKFEREKISSSQHRRYNPLLESLLPGTPVLSASHTSLDLLDGK